MLSCVIFNKSWVDAVTPKFLCLYWTYKGVVMYNFVTIGCVWTARLYFTNGMYAARMSSEQHMLPPTLWI